jgi:hypothetical protein
VPFLHTLAMLVNRFIRLSYGGPVHDGNAKARKTIFDQEH